MWNVLGKLCFMMAVNASMTFALVDVDMADNSCQLHPSPTAVTHFTILISSWDVH